MTNVNLNSQTYMTHALLPKLLERKGRSAIINVSSIATEICSGRSTLYTSTKSYNLHLSGCLHNAYKDKIDVIGVQPSGVESNLFDG